MNFSHALSISRTSFAARLASALVLSMQIPEGSALVCILGQGDESSNLSALSNWVEKELCKMDEDNLIDPLPVLIGNLERTLNAVQELMA